MARIKEISDQVKERKPGIICNFRIDLECKEASMGPQGHACSQSGDV